MARMRLRYPKSFFELMLAGFLLAVLPLLLGLLANTVAIERLAAQSQRAVYDAARVAHATRDLSETATSLERAARQSAILRDESLWQGYLTLHGRFAEAGLRLAALPLPAPMRADLEVLLRQEVGLNAQMSLAGLRSPQTPVIARRHDKITAGAKELLSGSARLIDREAESLRDLAAATESRVKGQLFLLLPLSLFVVAGFSYLLARPIAQIEQAIRGLGERRLDAPVEVHGPENLEQLGRQLDWLRLRLVQLEEQKSRFLQHISHELKTPLTALREGSDLLAEEVAGPLTEPQREIVRILRQHSLDLQRLIEDLLRHGEAEFQQAAIKLAPVKPAEIVDRVLNKQKLALAARHLRLARKVGDFVMRTDAERLRVVLDNLLSNAIKHSPHGGTITIDMHKENGNALLEVADEGPGVAAGDREHIFEPFYRGKAMAQGAIPGTGLGLSITREHVLALGGQIQAETGRGHFTVKLPLNQAA